MRPPREAVVRSIFSAALVAMTARVQRLNELTPEEVVSADEVYSAAMTIAKTFVARGLEMRMNPESLRAAITNIYGLLPPLAEKDKN